MGNAQAVAGSGALDPRDPKDPRDPRDPRDVERLETRAKEMDARITELEKRLKQATAVTTTPGPVAAVTPAAGSSSAQLTAAYVKELHSLRAVLVAAEGEHQEMVAKVSTLEETNRKLAYQIMHLKRNCMSET